MWASLSKSTGSGSCWSSSLAASISPILRRMCTNSAFGIVSISCLPSSESVGASAIAARRLSHCDGGCATAPADGHELPPSGQQRCAGESEQSTTRWCQHHPNGRTDPEGSACERNPEPKDLPRVQGAADL